MHRGSAPRILTPRESCASSLPSLSMSMSYFTVGCQRAVLLTGRWCALLSSSLAIIFPSPSEIFIFCKFREFTEGVQFFRNNPSLQSRSSFWSLSSIESLNRPSKYVSTLASARWVDRRSASALLITLRALTTCLASIGDIGWRFRLKPRLSIRLSSWYRNELRILLLCHKAGL